MSRPGHVHGAAAPPAGFPATLALPAGFQPESLTIGDRPFAYFGSLADGSIHRVDLATGEGRTISPGPGTPSAGMRMDTLGRLFVAGAFAGSARVVDAATGQTLADYALAAGPPTLVADVVLTPDAAWFTDAFVPVLYRLPLGAGGRLPRPGGVERIALTGDIVHAEGLNTCGIERTPDGAALLIVQPGTGILFHVDPVTGAATVVDLRGESLRGDGLLLSGRTLYAAAGPDNALAVVRLNAAGTRGEVVQRIEDERFDVPTAVAAYGDRLYLPNSRIGSVPPAPTTPYTAVAVPRP